MLLQGDLIVAHGIGVWKFMFYRNVAFFGPFTKARGGHTIWPMIMICGTGNSDELEEP